MKLLPKKTRFSINQSISNQKQYVRRIVTFNLVMGITRHLGNALLSTNLLTRLFWHRQFRRRNKPDGFNRVPTALDFYERVNFQRLLFSTLSSSSLLRFRETRIPVDPAFHFYTLFSLPSLPSFSRPLNPSFSQENDILKCHPLSRTGAELNILLATKKYCNSR